MDRRIVQRKLHEIFFLLTNGIGLTFFVMIIEGKWNMNKLMLLAWALAFSKRTICTQYSLYMCVPKGASAQFNQSPPPKGLGETHQIC